LVVSTLIGRALTLSSRKYFAWMLDVIRPSSEAADREVVSTVPLVATAPAADGFCALNGATGAATVTASWSTTCFTPPVFFAIAWAFADSRKGRR